MPGATETQRYAAVRAAQRLAPFVLLAGLCGQSALAQWTQWGGPNRDFAAQSTGLAEVWPDAGPRQIWRHDLGPGHSSIVVDDGRLYTMCRRDGQDVYVSLDAKTGETLWETKYDAPSGEKVLLDYGPGPHSTPLVVGDRLFGVGGMVQFHCLDRKTGEILWSYDLREDMKAHQPGRGYGASPIAYNDTVILVIGSMEVGLAAFKQATGEVAWKSGPLPGGVSSPILIEFGGRDHLIIGLANNRAALDPATGEELWKATVPRQSMAIMTTPLWISPDRVFYTAAYGGGSRMFKITQADGKFGAEELWHTRKMRVQHGTVVRQGDYIVGSSGDFGPAFLMAVHIDTGQLAWRIRGYSKCNMLSADGKLIMLDSEGNLMLATATADGLDIHSKAKVLEERSWTVPTLVGTTLYLRDNKTIAAFDLSAESNRRAG